MAEPLLLLFTLHLGALLAVATALAYDGWWRDSLPSRGAAQYLALSVATTATGSGWMTEVLAMLQPTVGAEGEAAWQHAKPWVFVLLVLMTALAGIVGSRRWLGFPWRGRRLDGPMRGMMRGLQSALLLALLLTLVHASGAFDLSAAQDDIAAVAGGLAVLALLVCAWVCHQMAQLSDRLSWWLTTGTLLTVPGIAGLVGLQAFGVPDNPWVWAVLVLMHMLAMLCTGMAAVLQSQLHNARHQAVADSANFDGLDRLASGEDLVPALGPKFERLRNSGTTPAVLLVNVYNHDAVAMEHGAAAADQVTLATLARLKTVLNPHDALGRYFDACFVALVRAEVDTHYLRELSLRLAAVCRRDVALRGVSAVHNDNLPIALDVGVGLCWSDRVASMADALQEAGKAATAARAEGSRACVVLYPDKPPLPVDAVLGGSERAANVTAV